MLGINKVIRTLILSDFFLLAAWGLVTPILAIFIIDKIQGGDAEVVGMAIGIYWISKSLIQIPIGKYLDKNHGEKDDYYFLVFGTLIASLTPLGFIFATLPWHMYILQLVHALGMAMAIPAWGGIFTRHIDKGKEAMTWGVESSSIGIGAGIAGIVGGIVAKNFGFIPLFIGVTSLGVISVLLFLLIKDDLVLKGKTVPFTKPE